MTGVLCRVCGSSLEAMQCILHVTETNTIDRFEAYNF